MFCQRAPANFPGDGSERRATCFVVAATFVEAVNKVNIVAVNTVSVLHLSKTGGLSVGRTVDRIDGRSDRHTSDWLF